MLDNQTGPKYLGGQNHPLVLIYGFTPFKSQKNAAPQNLLQSCEGLLTFKTIEHEFIPNLSFTAESR